MPGGSGFAGRSEGRTKGEVSKGPLFERADGYIFKGTGGWMPHDSHAIEGQRGLITGWDKDENQRRQDSQHEQDSTFLRGQRWMDACWLRACRKKRV
eukprot:scaffold148846_cov15-Tisochrysis_lutea.AAC.1